MASLSRTAYADAQVTFIFSFLSLLGSILVLLSYLVARSKSTPRIANLILHLAASDFFWFFSAGVQATYWLFSESGKVPIAACFILSPLMIFTRMASLAWTCVISFNVLMSVEKRKWLWQGGDESWKEYHKRYYVAIFLLAAPGTLLTLIKQHSHADTSHLGCSPDYEALGVWYEVFFPEVLPILMGFLVNVYVFLRVYGKISKSAYPQSVRKRRKRIMYHYIIVCIICWVPTVATYMIELIGFHSPEVEILARACLYSSGFLNFLVFGMQDPHLKRSFKLMLYYSGATTICMLVMPSPSYYYYFGGWAPLKATDVEKNVMFQESTISVGADTSKDKRSVYRNRKLSKADRLDLYMERPDLDLRTPVDASGSPVKSAMKGSRIGNNNNNSTVSVGGTDSASTSTKDSSCGTEGALISPSPNSGSSNYDKEKRDKERHRADRRKHRSGSDKDKDERRARAKTNNHNHQDSIKSNSSSNPCELASREEKAASLFHSHVKAGTLLVHSVVPAGAVNGSSNRVRSGSRSRSSSFHSGVSDGKFDLLEPLLGSDRDNERDLDRDRESKRDPVSGAASYPQTREGSSLLLELDAEERLSDSRASRRGNMPGPPPQQVLLGAAQFNPLLQCGPGPKPMSVVSAGGRSHSTERIVGLATSHMDLDLDLEVGEPKTASGIIRSGPGGSSRDVDVGGGGGDHLDNGEDHNDNDNDWSSACSEDDEEASFDADDLPSSSDDDSDDEDKELSTPIVIGSSTI